MDDYELVAQELSELKEKMRSVGQGPHGLLVWPQPGRYSLGHTGELR